jgi:hypothetical protein
MFRRHVRPSAPARLPVGAGALPSVGARVGVALLAAGAAVALTVLLAGCSPARSPAGLADL